MAEIMARHQPLATRRRIERDMLAQQCMMIHRSNLAVALLLCVLVLALMTFFISSSEAVFDVAHRVWLMLADFVGLTPSAQPDFHSNIANLPLNHNILSLS